MRVANNTEWLFSHLWKKNPDTSQCCPGINMTETIIFRWAQPYFWYSSAKDGTIARKTKDKVILTQVEEAFLHNMSKSNVVATCFNSQEDANFKTQEKIEFDYIDLTNFHNFIFQKEKPINLIMQKFLEPKNNKNAIIKVSWTPQFCICFRKTNNHELTNTKIPLVNRLVTFEGADHLSSSESVSTPALVSELEQTCVNIVRHIQGVTNGSIHIAKMVLYFKVDERNRLWLMYCTNLKFKERLGKSIKKKNARPLSPLLTVVSKKDEKNLKSIPQQQYIFEDQVNELNSEVCLECGNDGLLFDIKMKLLLDSTHRVSHNERFDLEEGHDSFLERYKQFEEAENRSKSFAIPEFIRKLYPNITEEKLLKLKTNPGFMHTPVKVCENCHQLITEAALDGNNEERRGKNIKIKLGDRSPLAESPYGTLRDGESTTPHNKDGLSTIRNPWEGSATPSRTFGQTARSIKIAQQLLNHPKLINQESKPGAHSIHSQSQFAQPDSVNMHRPRSGFPYLESFREKEAELSIPSNVKEHYFRATSAFHSPRDKVDSMRPMKSPMSPYAFEMSLLSPQQSHRKLTRSPVMIKKSPINKKLADVLMCSPQERVWSQNTRNSSRTNYYSMMSTVKDLKKFLRQNHDVVDDF